jgi:hypothetical protein
MWRCLHQTYVQLCQPEEIWWRHTLQVDVLSIFGLRNGFIYEVFSSNIQNYR